MPNYAAYADFFQQKSAHMALMISLIHTTMLLMDIGQNIRNRRRQLKMTLEQLAHEVGSDTGNLSRIERGQQGLSLEKIQGIANALGCSARDLMSDQGEETAPVGYVRIPVIHNDQVRNWKKIYHHVPMLGILEWILSDQIISKSAFALVINDDSNIPEFKLGDKVIIDTEQPPEAGDFVVATTKNEEVVFRKYRARGSSESGEPIFELTPVNADYATLDSRTDNISIVGVVIEHRIFRRKR